MNGLMWEQFATATTMGARQHLRNTLFLALLVVLPVAFITTSFARTPDVPYALLLQHGGEGVLTPVGMRNLHGALMVPMTVSFLAGCGSEGNVVTAPDDAAQASASAHPLVAQGSPRR